MIPSTFYKLTDSAIGTFTELQNIDVLYAVDKSDTSQDPQGTSKRLPVGLVANHVISLLPNYIPLEGTDNSNPVTGPLILSDGLYLSNREDGSVTGQAKIEFQDSNLYLYANEPGIGHVGVELHPDISGVEPYFKVYSNLTSFAGIEYESDYAPNFRANSLVTKAWVEDQISGIVIPDPNLNGVITVAMQPLNSSTLSPAIIGDAVIPYDCQIVGWYIFGTDASGASVSGSAEVDVYLDTYANWPPTVLDTVFPTDKPTLTAQSKNFDTGLSIPLLEGYVLRVELKTVSTFGRLYLSLITESI